jgi:hypothetical protein
MRGPAWPPPSLAYRIRLGMLRGSVQQRMTSNVTHPVLDEASPTTQALAAARAEQGIPQLPPAVQAIAEAWHIHSFPTFRQAERGPRQPVSPSFLPYADAKSVPPHNQLL